MANTKIDSIKLSGSTETYDLDLPSTATPNIAGLTTSGLSVNGNLTVTGSSNLTNANIAGNIKIFDPTDGESAAMNLYRAGTGSDNTFVVDASLQPKLRVNYKDLGFQGETALIQGTGSVNIKSNESVFIGSENTFVNVGDVIELSTVGGIKLNSNTSLIMKSGYNIRLSATGGSVECRLPASFSTTTEHNIISLETSYFLDSKSPCISLTNYKDASASVNGKIGITPTQGIGLLKIYDGSAGTDTYLTVSDNCVDMGVANKSGYEYTSFAYFGEKYFNITLSQNLLDDGADPFIRIGSNLSNFSVEFPSDQTDITIDPHNLVLNRITPKITTSDSNLIAYPGCGYTQSNDSYVIPAVAGIKLKRTDYGESIANTLSGSTLSVHQEFILNGDVHGAIYQIWGREVRQYGELRVTYPANSSDTYTYAAVTGESAYWGASTLCLTVVIPAGKTGLLQGKNITSLYYSKTSLEVSKDIINN